MRFTRARYSNRVPSPRDRRRACLCDDGRTYSTKCCEGGFQNQGIGSLSGGESSIIIPPEVESVIPPPPPAISDYNKYRISACTGGGSYNIFTSQTLIVSAIYDLTLSNGASGCFRVGSEASTADVLVTAINSVAFDGCSDCAIVLDPEGDPAPTCTDKVLVIQICNENAAVDDNFDVLLNNTKIGEVDLNQDARIGSFFIGSTNTDISITGLEDGFLCSIDDMVVYRFDPSLLYEGTNTLFMKNTQLNNNGNAGSIGIRNYSLDGNNLSDPCDIQDLFYSGTTGVNFVQEFTFNTCCANLDCSQITFSGFSVSESGTVTAGTADIGTIISTTPSSVSANTGASSIPIDLTVRVEAPSPYVNQGSQFDCTVTVNQPGNTLDCSEVTISGFDLYASGRYNSSAVSVDIGTIDSMSPGSFSTVTTETTRTLTVNIIVPSGYANSGQTIACTTTDTQLPIFTFAQQTPSSGTYVELEPIINTGTSTYAFSVYANDPVTGKTNAFALMNQLGNVIAGQNTGANTTFNLGNVRISFYSPSDVLLAQYRAFSGTFIYTTPDDLSSVPSSPYGGNASNWTSYKMVFTGISSVGGTAASSPSQETMISNNSDAGYYWVIEDLS